MKSGSFARAAARLGLAAVVLALAAGPALAQSAGRVEGTVTDTTGANVPGASVTATNLGTNALRETVTDTEGAFSITPLPAGPYEIKVSMPGFKEQTTKLTLNVNQVARLEFKLELGGVTETVEVTGVAPLIDRSTSFIGTVVDSQQVEDLPLNGRNFTQLTTLAPGITRGTPGSAASGQNQSAETFRYAEYGGAAISANGLREQFNSFQLDGIDNNETLVNSIAYMPSPEVIQEFRAITTNAPAEFGRAGGAVQNIVTKSGTNLFHGSGYYYKRPRSMAATPAFASEKPEFDNEDFGGTIGGPIIKDKTFFFASYHGLRSSLPVETGNLVTVPTVRMRSGDFGELLDTGISGLPSPVIVYDPVTGQPFPGNVIPQDRISTVGRNYLNVYPQPTQAGVLRNFLSQRQKDSTYDDFDGRIDHTFSQRDQLFVRGSHWSNEFSDPGRIPGYQAGFGAGTSRNKGFMVGLGETHTFSSSVVNELRAGYIDFKYEFLPVGFGTDQNAAIGIGGPGGITLENGISLIGGGDGRYIEYLGDYGQYQIKQKTYQIADTVTWIKGRHTLKFGGSLIRRTMSQTRTQVGKGFYFFRDGFGFEPGFTGYEVADMLIGTTTFSATGNPGYVPREVVSWENSVFAQDDLRVGRKLTLNLGLRWDLFTPYYEKDDKLANYDPATGGLAIPNENGVPRSTIDTDSNNFGPRVGFSYQLNERTVLRGSYGIFYALDRGGIDNQLTENPPGVVTEYRFSGDGARLALSDEIPLPTPVDPDDPVLPAGSGVVYIPRDSKTSRVQQFSFGGQRELTSNTAIMLVYVGTRGDNLAAKLTNAGFQGDNVADRLSTIKYMGTSQYDAVQASLRRNLSGGLSYLASYTLSWAKDDVPSLYPGGPSRGAPVYDPDDLSGDWGYADSDSRHRFTFAGTYELPWAKGNKILGGWSINTVITLQSGNPFTVYSEGAGPQRADQSGDPSYPDTEVENPDGSLHHVQWLDPSAFSAPASGQGSAERNSVRAPGIRTIDLSVFKTIALWGRANLELRLEGFNILDTAQYSQPNQVLNDPNFGRITQTKLNTERQFQVAARFTF
jgi:hypothetical protein